MRLRTNEGCGLRLGSSIVSAPVWKHTGEIVSRLHRTPGTLWDTLLSLHGGEEVIPVFERARGEPGNPFALPLDIVFPVTEYPMRVSLGRRCSRLVIEDAEMLQSLQQTLSGEWRGLPESDPAHELALELLAGGVLVPDAARQSFERPGIYRLQHAGLLFRSASGTGILTDPVVEFGEHDWILPQTIPNVDAVVVSHSHGDHFSLFTLLQFPRRTTMIVPEVPRPSMLCPSMATLLRDAGFENVIAAPWYSRVVVKDVVIHAYPFYGEQPWLNFGAPVADLRNHGNTYVVEMDGRTAWFLIDSGQEFGHRMDDVCEKAQQKHGRIDIVFSNLRAFPWRPALIDGSGRYLFCFSTDTLNNPETWPYGQLVTFATSGIHGFLRQLKPAQFFPYAHWWQPSEQAPHQVDGVLSEAEMLERVRDAGGAGELETALHRWQVGNRLQWDRSQGSIGKPVVVDDGVNRR